MAERDWDRFGRHLRALGDMQSWARDAFLVAVGVFGGGGLAVIAWLAQLSQLAEDPSDLFIVAGMLILAITLAAGVIAIVSYLMSKGLEGRLKRDAQLLYEDMDHVHPFTQAVPQSPERSTHDQ